MKKIITYIKHSGIYQIISTLLVPPLLMGLFVAMVHAAPNYHPSSVYPGQLYSSVKVHKDFGPFNNNFTAYNLSYQSTSTISGYPGQVTGTLFVPNGTAPAGGWPVIAYAHGTTGVASRCAPSITDYPQLDAVFSAILHRGYAIVSTDYRGLGSPGPHPYLDARSEAYDVLDSVKAAFKTGHNLSNNVVILGFSQGGQAAQKSIELAPTYAPDVHILGSAEIVPLLALDPMIKLLIDRKLSVHQVFILPFLVKGVQVKYPSIRFSDYMAGALLQAAQKGKQICVQDLLSGRHLADLPIIQHVDNSWYAPISQQAKTDIIDFGSVNRLPVVRAHAPIFISRAQGDTIINYDTQTPAIKKMCQLGDQVTVQVRGGDHGVEGSLGPALDWTDNIFHHRTVPNNCDTILKNS